MYVYIYIYTQTLHLSKVNNKKKISLLTIIIKYYTIKNQRQKNNKKILIIIRINIENTKIKIRRSNGFLQELYSTKRNIVWRFPGRV